MTGAPAGWMMEGGCQEAWDTSTVARTPGLHGYGFHGHLLGALLAAGALAAREDCTPVNDDCDRPEDPTLEITRGPYLQGLLATSVEVIWRTRDRLECQVRWQEEGAPASRQVLSPEDTAHRVAIDGLVPGKRHRYEVLDREGRLLAGGGPFTFRAAPDPAGTFRLVAIGDSGSLKPPQFEIAAALCRMDPLPELFLHTGDIIYDGTPDCTIFHPYARLFAEACFYPARGNHDLLAEREGVMAWNETFFPPLDEPGETPTSYSFDWGSAHFATVDTADFSDFDAADPRFSWLKDDLARARDRGSRWLILFDHIPLYTVGGYENESEVIRDLIGPIADQFDIDLVLSGHDHNYQRTHPVRAEVVRDAWQGANYVSPRGTIYVVTGGGGQVRYPDGGTRDLPFLKLFRFAFHAVEIEVAPERLVVTARGCPLAAGTTCLGEAEVLDTFTITKGTRTPMRFRRGDLDFDGAVNIADPIALLNHLFAGRTLRCAVVGDADLSGDITIADPIRLLNHLFQGGPTLPPPYPDCGEAAVPDDAFCLECMP
jgi:hypothetical protein